MSIITPTRRYGGVRILDSPCLRNVQRLDQLAWPMIDMMHTNGIRIDVPYLHDLDAKLANREREITAEFRMWTADVWPDCMISSPDQIAELLFDRFGMVPPGNPRQLKSGRLTTEDEVLSSMLGDGFHPVVRTVLDYREIAKLRNTYTVPIPRLLKRWDDGRLRTVFKATRTATGRLSSGDRSKGFPNLQNIPTRGDWGKLVRLAFTAGLGNVLVGADLSQIEMRMAAHLSRDQAMCEIFRLRLDIHNRTACALFKLAVERINYLAGKVDAKAPLTPEETKEWKYFKQNQRAPAKNLGFGVLYGLTAEGLRANIMAEGGPELSIEECEKYIADWFAAYPGIKEWMELQYSRARRYDMVWDLVGRIRPIPDVKSQLQEKVSSGLRDAGNMPVQSGAQAVIKLAMAELTPIVLYYQSFKDVTCLPLLQIHDELITECSPDIAKEFAEIKRTVMREAVELIVPVDSSADIAERWGELK